MLYASGFIVVLYSYTYISGVEKDVRGKSAVLNPFAVGALM